MALKVKRMTDLALAGKRVLIREDLNVPVKDGKVTSTARIDAALPTLRAALDAGARVHGHVASRPAEGRQARPGRFAEAGRREARRAARARTCRSRRIGSTASTSTPGELVLCENVRFNVGEEADDDALAKRMAALCDVFVMDAFGTAHRAQASTNGVARHAPIACAGPLLVAELEALGQGAREPEAAADRDHRRLEGLDEDRGAAIAVDARSTS